MYRTISSRSTKQFSGGAITQSQSYPEQAYSHVEQKLFRKQTCAGKKLLFNGVFSSMDRTNHTSRNESRSHAVSAAVNRTRVHVSFFFFRRDTRGDHSKIARFIFFFLFVAALYLRASCSTICFSEYEGTYRKYIYAV